MEYIQSDTNDGAELAEIRAAAMQPSLEALGRFDESRVRNRFLDTFKPLETFKIIKNGELLGFYSVKKRDDHHYLDHLYIKPEHQNKKAGEAVVKRVIAEAKAENLPVRLGALKESRSNHFYIRNGFRKTHQDEFDVYYEYQAHKQRAY